LLSKGIPDPPIQEITAALVRRYSYHLTGKNDRPRNIRGALHAIRSLFDYLVQLGAVSSNPAKEVRLPKKDAATRLLVTDEDLIALRQATERQAADFRCVRDRAALSVLIFCGLRRQEFLDLRVGSVNLTDQSLLVQQGKGQKARTIYLCPDALSVLREWLGIRQKRQCSHDYLFITQNHRHFGDTSLMRTLEEIKAIAGLRGDPRIKPHSIRHAAATRLLRNGADIRSIHAWLGHSQLQTTAIYLHTEEQQVRKIAPLAGFQPSQRSDSTSAPKPAEQAESRAGHYRRRRTGR